MHFGLLVRDLIDRFAVWLGSGLATQDRSRKDQPAVSQERAAYEASNGDLLFTVYLKGREGYIFIYTGDTSKDAINSAARWAADPSLSFDLEDADRCYDEINARVEAE